MISEREPVLAEASSGIPNIPDGYIGLGVFGLLATFTGAVMKRTSDVDRRRDETVKIATDLARERELAANEERDRALSELREAKAEIDDLREELEALRDEHDAERREWQGRAGRD